jgi:hypothetical protein
VGLARVVPFFVILIVVAIVVIGGRSLVVGAGSLISSVSGELRRPVAAVGGGLLVIDGSGGRGSRHWVNWLHWLGKVVTLHVETVLVGRVVDGDGFALGVDVAVGTDAAAVGGDALALLQTVVGGERVFEWTVVVQRLFVTQDGGWRRLVLAVVVLLLLTAVVLATGCGGQGDDEEDALKKREKWVVKWDISCVFL